MNDVRVPRCAAQLAGPFPERTPPSVPPRRREGRAVIPANETVDKPTLALRQAQGERNKLSKNGPTTAQAEPVEAGFAHLSTLSFAGMTRGSSREGGDDLWGKASGGRAPYRRDSFQLLGILLLLLLAPEARAQFWQAAPTPPAAEPTILRDVGIDQRLNELVPLDTVFRDESGREVRLGEYFGTKPVILSLAYYECPMLCSLVLNGLASALGVLSFDIGKEFDVVTISFDPRDTAEQAAVKKRTYVQRYPRTGAETGWHFLTGAAPSIERVAKAVGFRYAYDSEQKQFAHAAGIMVLTPEGRLARYFYGIEYSPRDLRLGLIEAAERRIGSPVDQILLYCFQYDPHTGRYGAVIINIVRLGGAATLVVLGAFITAMLLRDRRRQRGTMGKPIGHPSTSSG